MTHQQRLAISQIFNSQSNQSPERRAQIISIDLWQQKMEMGNQAFQENNPVFALRFFKQASDVANNLLLLSFQQGSDPTVALQALDQAHRNLTELYVRYEVMEEAINLREDFFFQLIEFLSWNKGNLLFREKFLFAMETELENLLMLYYTMDINQDKIRSVIGSTQNIRNLKQNTN